MVIFRSQGMVHAGAKASIPAIQEETFWALVSGAHLDWLADGCLVARRRRPMVWMLFKVPGVAHSPFLGLRSSGPSFWSEELVDRAAHIFAVSSPCVWKGKNSKF